MSARRRRGGRPDCVSKLVYARRQSTRGAASLTPAEVAAMDKALLELADEVDESKPWGTEERLWILQARTIFLTNVLTGLRRGELRGLRWKHVRLADPESGPMLEVHETFLNGRTDTPKSEAGERVIALGERLAAELFDHRARSAYQSDEERVFALPRRGRHLTRSATQGRSGRRRRRRASRSICGPSMTSAGRTSPRPAMRA